MDKRKAVAQILEQMLYLMQTVMDKQINFNKMLI